MGRKALADRLARLERLPQATTPDPWAAARRFREMSGSDRDQVMAVWIELTRLDALDSPLTTDGHGDLRLPDGRLVAQQGGWEALRLFLC